MQLESSTFTPPEIQSILDSYDLGKVKSVRMFRAGSPFSPKAIIETDRGEFLLKRRAPGRDDPLKVAFAHELQIELRHHKFPLPHLQGTSINNNTILQLHGTIYEIFEYIPAQPYDRSASAAHDAGRVLALYHKILAKYQAAFTPPQGCIHNNADVLSTIESRLKILRRGSPGVPLSYLDDLRSLLGALNLYYKEAAATSNSLGLSQWPRQITHADWHPSNLLYVDQSVVGVIDFDSARIQQRAIDVANACVQFCTYFDKAVAPDEWPAELELLTFRSFMAGYDSVYLLSAAEIDAIPHLMVEAIIAEPVLAARNAKDLPALDNYIPWLEMARRKAAWINGHSEPALEAVRGHYQTGPK